MANGKFYLTTPIYYVNDQPHVGHLYTTIVADVLARYHRMRGTDVFFLTGTDENSQKNVEAAAKRGYGDIQAYLDMMAETWKGTWTDLGITFDDFIRTTEERHVKGVEQFWRIVRENGDIYLGEYEGFYCTGCEAFVNQSDLVDGKCAIHKKEPTTIKEKNFFFRLSKYREKLLAHIDANPDFIQPVSRRNEVRSYVDKFMEDISISRESGEWGIPVPDEQGHVIYVWFDALLNYMTGVGYGSDDALFARYWPADLHLVGKDIIKFHCALWPAMLMAAGIPLPKQVFAHGFFTINGEKMSKSLGNVIDPRELAAKYGMDTVRYFLLREITFGEDGDFSVDRLTQRYAGELANEFGNLVHRTLSMTEKYFEGKVPDAADGDLAEEWLRYEESMATCDFAKALDTVWGIIRSSNQRIDTEKPWVLAKEGNADRLGNVLYTLLERLRHVAWMLMPIMPDVSARTFAQLGRPDDPARHIDAEAKAWGGMRKDATLAKGEPLFPRLEE